MSKQVNKTLIGGFVIGAAAIVVAGILIFGGGSLLNEKHHFVLFFDGSTKGLNVGAPVQLKGVTMGQVTDIRLIADATTMKFYTQVIIEVLPDKIVWAGGDANESELPNIEEQKLSKLLIRKGLRAKMEMVSFVTGQLQVSFDFYPDTEIRLTDLRSEYDEMPTLQSDMEALANKLQKIPLNELVDEILAAVRGLKKIVNSPKIEGTFATLDQTLKDVSTLAKRLDSQVVPLSNELQHTLRDTRQLVNNLDSQVEPVAGEIDTTLKTATETLENVTGSLEVINQLLASNSEFRSTLRETLQEISSAARSARILTDYLEQHPEALLQGKAGGN